MFSFNPLKIQKLVCDPLKLAKLCLLFHLLFHSLKFLLGEIKTKQNKTRPESRSILLRHLSPFFFSLSLLLSPFDLLRASFL